MILLKIDSIIYNSAELCNTTTLTKYLALTCGTMTGSLTTNSIIYNSVELSNTTFLTNKIKLGGGTMTGKNHGHNNIECYNRIIRNYFNYK